MAAAFHTTHNDRPRLVALLTGHSFIRRLRQSFGYHSDIRTPHLAEQFARDLKVDKKFSHVYTITITRDKHVKHKVAFKNLNLVSDLPSYEDMSRLHHGQGPNFIVADIASNDLSKCMARNPAFVTSLAKRICDWALDANVRVVFQAVMARTNGISSSPWIFNYNREALNQNIRCRVEENLQFNLRFNKMQGMGKEEDFDNFIDEDGIHVTRPAGKYLDRVRNSLLDPRYHR